jgi:asparagine synthase (glutamine-hydrolysing)
MCGIAGVCRWDGGPADRDGLERMVRSLSHRGPDSLSCRAYDNGRVVLGHARLAIIDLSTGDQPMSSEDGRVGIVFNGEIYNYLELREQFRSRGVGFTTKSDTEVILRAYEFEGADSTSRLRGMFAYAIYDAHSRRLVLARDRVGKKPLYVMERQDEIVFASELKAILAYLGEAPPVDWSFLPDYLMLGYVPQPRTPFVGIRKLPAGHRLVAEPGRTSVTAYWEPPRFEPGIASEEDALGRVSGTLEQAVAIRLRSDVPFGALLSGGVDSSLVTALMVRSGKLNWPPRTFSVGFAQGEHNELPTAGAIASHLGTEHQEQLLRIDVADVLPRIAWHMDEPFADSSAVPTWYVCAMAASAVRMVLTGDGGDELFCGYDRYRRFAQIAAVRRWPGAAALLSGVSRLVPTATSGLAGQARRLSDYLALPPAAVHARLVGIFEPDGLSTLGIEPPDGYPPSLISKAWEHGGRTDLDRAMHVDVRSYLLDDVLVKVDRMAMAHSLEVRSPLLDHELLEVAAAVPLPFKRHGSGPGKLVLRKMAASLIPADILALPKRGFSAPVDDWYRGGPLRQPFEDEVKGGGEVMDRLDAIGVRGFLLAADRGEPATGEKLFALHTLLLWHRLCVANLRRTLEDNSAGRRSVEWIA